MKNFAWTLIALIAGLAGVLLMLPEPGREAPDSAPTAERTFITGAHVFDGEEFIDDATLVIADGRVEALGSDLAVDDGAEIFDASGKTILPGLIDAHVHSFGTARADALRFGVTTMLDMFRLPLDFQQTHAERESLAPTDQADLYSAGFLATAPGGHGTQYGIEVPTLTGPEEAAEWVAARKDEGSDWIKVVIEPGWGERELPTLDAATVAALIEAAHANDLMAVAHVSTYADAMLAIEAGIDGLVHLFGDRRINQAFLGAVRESGIFVVPTTPVLAAAYGHDSTDWLLNQPTLGPRLSAAQRRNLEARFPGAGADGEQWAALVHNIGALHDAGVPILAGSDAPNPGTTYGASIHHALRLLVAAGLSPIDALRAATSVPARAFSLDQRGCLQPGCRADLLIVDGDPLETIEATTRIDGIWKNGRRMAVDADGGDDHRAPVEDRGTAAAPAEPIDLLTQPERWMAAADDYLGGQSRSSIDWLEAQSSSTLAVDADVESGFAFPYAGAMWNTTAIPMQPADHAGHRRLVIEIDGPGSGYQVMFFSGEAPGAQPVRVPLSPGQQTVIELGDLDGLDRSTLRAIGVFATEQSDPRQFTLTRARLE